MTDLVWVVSSSVLIAAVILIRRFFGKRMTAGLRYALWGLVLIRLIVPGTVFSSLISVKSAVVGTQVGVLVEDAETFRQYTLLTLKDNENGGTDIVGIPYSANAAEHKDTAVTVIKEVTPERFERVKKTVSIVKILNVVWYSGMGVIAAYFIFVNFRFWLRLRKRRVLLDDIAAPCRVYAAEGLPSSCLFFDSVYVSKQAAEDSEALRCVIAHELAHRRHGDAVFALLRDAALVLHWYNPLVWAAALLSVRDSEIFADAGAIKTLGEEQRQSYGLALIRLTASCRSRANIGVAATAMTNGKRTLKERMKHMSNKTKTSAIIVLAVLILSAAAVICSFLGCERSVDPKDASAYSEPTVLPTESPAETEMQTEVPTDELTMAQTDAPTDAPTAAPLFPETEFGGKPQPGEMPHDYPRMTDYGELPEEYRSIVANNILHSSNAWQDCVLKGVNRFGYSGALLTRYDLYGNEVLSFDADSIEHEGFFNFAYPTSDGGLIIAYGGTIIDNCLESPGASLAKISKDGELQWKRDIEDGTKEIAEYCFELDGAYFILGNYAAPDAPDTPDSEKGANWDLFIAKIGSDGRELKRVYLGGSRYDFLYRAYPEKDAICMEVRTFSTDGDISLLTGGSQINHEWLIMFDSELNATAKTRERGYYDVIGHLDGKAVLNNGDHETHTGVIDFGDHYIVAWENVLGFYPDTPTTASSPWCLTETVYEDYTKDGTLIWRRAIGSTPDYAAKIASWSN